MQHFLSETLPYTLLYFYPKDSTPGCTLEAQDFTRLKGQFSEIDIEIVGVSKDSETSHQKFVSGCNLWIRLIADESKELHEKFGVIGEKNNYGKISIGVIRSTFLLDSKTGDIIKEWRNVRAKWHAEKVLREVKPILGA